MSGPLTLFVESEIAPGKAAELRALLGRVIAHCAETEPGMLAYDWYVDAEETECRVVERYADSEAVLFHFQNYARFGAEMAECRTIRRLTLLGEPEEALRKALEAMSPPVFGPFAGLDRS